MRLTVCRGPTPTTRTPGMTGTSATCRPGGAGVAARSVAIARDRGDATWASFSTGHYDPGFNPPPLKDTSSTRPRAAGIALWRRRAVRAPVCDAAAPFRRGTGSMDARYASCRSPVGPAGSYHCHGLRRIPRHLCSLCSSCTPFRVGTAPHATAKHDSPAPPRRARPTPRVPRRSQAVRSSLNWCAPRDRAHFRLRARRVARVVHAETARVRPEAVPNRSAVPGRRVGFRTDHRRYGSSFTVVRRWAGHASGFGQGELCALCTPRPLRCTPRPSHTPALALAAASLVCTSARARRSL